MLRILIRKIVGLGRSNFGIGKRTAGFRYSIRS